MAQVVLGLGQRVGVSRGRATPHRPQHTQVMILHAHAEGPRFYGSTHAAASTQRLLCSGFVMVF